MKPSDLHKWLVQDLVEKSRPMCQTIPKFLDACVTRCWVEVRYTSAFSTPLHNYFFTQYLLLQTWQFLYIIQRPDDHLSLLCVFWTHFRFCLGCSSLVCCPMWRWWWVWFWGTTVTAPSFGVEQQFKQALCWAPSLCFPWLTSITSFNQEMFATPYAHYNKGLIRLTGERTTTYWANDCDILFNKHLALP